MRQALEARFARALAAAGEAPRDPGWPAAALPPALRESLVAAARIDACPDAVVAHYCERMPALLVEQLRPDDAPRALLRRPLVLARLPRLRAALDGPLPRARRGRHRCARAGRCGHAGGSCWRRGRRRRRSTRTRSSAAGCRSSAPTRPTAPRSPPSSRAATPTSCSICGCRRTWSTSCATARRAACDGAPAPWLVAEAAATHLGAAARTEHLFPEEPGEALRGVSLFVLVGEVLARRFGRAALWRVALGVPTTALFGARTARALDGAAWDDWRARQEAPFARDALGALGWIKLIDAARAEETPALEATGARPWPTLPWWSDPVEDADRAMVPRAVAALFQVNALAPAFVTLPSEPPHARLWLDVADCRLRAEPRAEGVFGEPAWWLFPPPLARALAGRGAERVRIDGATRARRGAIAARLVELCDGRGALPREVELSWASSR